MEELRFAPKDAKIIKENPGKSPYELRDLGISAKAFEKLMSQTSTEPIIISDESLIENNEVDSGNITSESRKPEIQAQLQNPSDNISGQLIPKLTNIATNMSYMKHRQIGPNQVLVKTPSGRVNPMGKEFAAKLVSQNSGYTIVSNG